MNRITQGKLQKPDLVVMIDTEREKQNVLDYQKKHIKPLCKDVGLEYERRASRSLSQTSTLSCL